MLKLENKKEERGKGIWVRQKNVREKPNGVHTVQVMGLDAADCGRRLFV